MLNFNDREMTTSLKQNFRASDVSSRNNAHRLLLFYAVESGLKALYMKRNTITTTKNLGEEILTHNINSLLDKLGAERSLKLLNNIKMSRSCGVSVEQIHEMWRYGGKANGVSRQPTDKDIEEKLIKINKWLTQELNRL